MDRLCVDESSEADQVLSQARNRDISENGCFTNGLLDVFVRLGATPIDGDFFIYCDSAGTLGLFRVESISPLQ